MTVAVKERSTVDLEKLKSFIYMPTSITADDVILELSLEAAKEAADSYLNNPFLDPDDNEEPIPASVEMGVLVYAAFEADRQSPGIASKRTDRLAETYRATGEVAGEIESRHWWYYRINPGL